MIREVMRVHRSQGLETAKLNREQLRPLEYGGGSSQPRIGPKHFGAIITLYVASDPRAQDTISLPACDRINSGDKDHVWKL